MNKGWNITYHPICQYCGENFEASNMKEPFCTDECNFKMQEYEGDW